MQAENRAENALAKIIVATYPADMNKDTFMKVRVTKQEQAEWRDICRALGQDFSAVVRDTMKRRAASIKRKQEVEQ
jgi:hypothetical protein